MGLRGSRVLKDPNIQGLSLLICTGMLLLAGCSEHIVNRLDVQFGIPPHPAFEGEILGLDVNFVRFDFFKLDSAYFVPKLDDVVPDVALGPPINVKLQVYSR